MELIRLRYFYTVGKMLNISQAAKIHGIPQPAMSKTIASLESELGVKLFDRSKNHLSLTKAGQLFMPEVEKALEHLDYGIREMESKKNALSGDLRLSIMYHRNTCIHCIDRFSKDYPGVNFSIYNNWADPGPFDLCIGGPDRVSQYDSSISLLREEIRLVVPFGHRLANNSKVAIDDLKNEKFIISSTSNQMFQIFQAVAKDAGFIPNVSIVSNDLYCIRQYFDLGMGIALIPRFSWVTLFKDSGVIIPFESPIYRTVHMFWDMHNLSKPSLALFKQYMEDEFRKISEGQS